MTSEKINNLKTIQTATQLSPVYQLISQWPITPPWVILRSGRK